MSRNTSTTTFQGFSVYQPSLGATLQWLPALGSQELDDLITAFLPGPASIQDKRAHVSMDFFEYARQTGQNFKFYSISNASFTSTTNSPASTAMYDSGYNSGMNTSPDVSDLGSSWTRSPATFTSSSYHSKSRAAPKRPSSDFSGHPGMRIMTKDGQDVTNSASRGSKTKQQRDHAHLMRIIKACDSCKRKKTRCDPSHKKRSTAQAPPVQTETKTSKKTKKATLALPVALPLVDPSLFVAEESFDPIDTDAPFSFGSSCESLDDLWNKFVDLEPEPLFFSHDAQLPQDDYDFFVDPHGHFSPSSGSSSASPSQVFTPFTPSTATRASPTYATKTRDEGVEPWASEPHLPYLDPDGSHGTNYVDFNLYSPASDCLDEEPELVQKSVSPFHRHGGASQTVAATVAVTLQKRGAERGYPDTLGDTMSSPSHSRPCSEDVLSAGYHQQLLKAVPYSPRLGNGQDSQLDDVVESFVSCSRDSRSPHADAESYFGTEKDRLQCPKNQSTSSRNLHAPQSSFALGGRDSRTLPQLAAETTSALASTATSQPGSDLCSDSSGIIQRLHHSSESTTVRRSNYGSVATDYCQSLADMVMQTRVQHPDVTRRKSVLVKATTTHTRPQVHPGHVPSASSTASEVLQVASSFRSAVIPTTRASSSKSSIYETTRLNSPSDHMAITSPKHQPYRSSNPLPANPSDGIVPGLEQATTVCDTITSAVNHQWTIAPASDDAGITFIPAMHLLLATTYSILQSPMSYHPGDDGHVSKVSVASMVAVMILAAPTLLTMALFSTCPFPLTGQFDLYNIFLAILGLVVVFWSQFIGRLQHHKSSRHLNRRIHPMPTASGHSGVAGRMSGAFTQNLEASICAITRSSDRFVVGCWRNDKQAKKATFTGHSPRSLW